MPERSFSLVSLTALVIASMIGAGVFTTSGFALADLGTPGRVLLAWFVGGLIAFCGAISYGALAHRMTESGGEYLFLSRAIHPLVGFLAGWISLLAGFTGAIAFAATAFAAYAVPDEMRPAWLSPDVLATVVVIGAGLLHGRYKQGGVLSQTLTVGVKLGLITLFLPVRCNDALHFAVARWPSPYARSERALPVLPLSVCCVAHVDFAELLGVQCGDLRRG